MRPTTRLSFITSYDEVFAGLSNGTTVQPFYSQLPRLRRRNIGLGARIYTMAILSLYLSFLWLKCH